jgi:hypothetical protein
MIKKIFKQYKRIRNGGYIGGLKSVFENINLIDDVLSKNTDSNHTIVEVGSERGFGSTYYLAKYCVNNNLNFITIDPSEDSIQSARKIINKFSSDKLKAVKQTGEDFFKENDIRKIVLAYLDGFDVIFPGASVSQDRVGFYASLGIDFLKDGNRISAEVHLETAKLIFKNVVQGGVVAIDDTFYENNEWLGKGKLAVPFLLENGFKSVNSIERKRDHSILLQKE